MPETLEKGRPVEALPIEYEWHGGDWKRIFDKQIEFIKNDILRARADLNVIVYLSCPISARGGGYHGTNIDIARFTERTLLQQWGERFWILNPAQYQLESKAGIGLMERHAHELNIDLAKLRVDSNAGGGQRVPSGGDYMRMWTKVLVEDDAKAGLDSVDPTMPNTGQHFDAFYFLGPSDAQAFFTKGGISLSAGIESYFARRFATDPDFRNAYAVGGIDGGGQASTATLQDDAARKTWERTRLEFLRYYGLRASANFSLGSHDEWNIFRLINQRRMKLSRGDVGNQLAGYFDGGQLDPGSTEMGISRGYALRQTRSDEEEEES